MIPSISMGGATMKAIIYTEVVVYSRDHQNTIPINVKTVLGTGYLASCRSDPIGFRLYVTCLSFWTFHLK